MECGGDAEGRRLIGPSRSWGNRWRGGRVHLVGALPPPACRFGEAAAFEMVGQDQSVGRAATPAASGVDCSFCNPSQMLRTSRGADAGPHQRGTEATDCRPMAIGRFEGIGGVLEEQCGAPEFALVDELLRQVEGRDRVRGVGGGSARHGSKTVASARPAVSSGEPSVASVGCVRIGVTYFCTDRSMDVRELAHAAEERGLHSLFVPEHTHIPTARRTPYPGGEPLPDEYTRTYDPFVVLAAAAAVTERLVVGTGICLVAQRDVIVTAKEVATLANLSGGRFVFGVGYGWNVDEMEGHGVHYGKRRAVVDEKLAAMQRMWEDDPAEYDGAHVALSESWVRPQPHHWVPVLMGGAAGPKLFDAIAQVANGWIPIGGRGLGETIPELRAAFERNDRDPASAHVVPFGVIPDPGKLEHFAAFGIDHVVCQLPHATRDEILPVLDRYAELVDRVGQ